MPSVETDPPDIARILGQLLHALQAQGERLGAATWRSFAAGAVFLGCALLEEENAACLETLLAQGG